jgi:hypothetical protein
MRSPSNMPISAKQSPSARYQNVEPGLRTTHEIGSISSSRSSPAGDGKPADTPNAPTVIVEAIAGLKIDMGLNSGIRTKKEHIPRFVKLESLYVELSLGITFGP